MKSLRNAAAKYGTLSHNKFSGKIHFFPSPCPTIIVTIAQSGGK
jgi:hypothetical protein